MSKAVIGSATQRRHDGLLWVRLLLYGLFAALWIVWLVQPDSPSRLFRELALGWLAIALTLIGVSLLHGPTLRALRRCRRIADLAVANLLLLLLIGEGALRLAGALWSTPLLVPPDARAQERIRSHRGAPGEVLHGFRLNELGMFDEAFREERTPGMRRIVALGDSFAVGVVAYEQNFLSLLDRRLVGYEVLNFGIVGIALRDYLHVYRTEARAFDPDLVLVCFFVGNDFEARRTPSVLHADSLYVFTVIHRLWSIRGEMRRRNPDAPLETAFSDEAFRAIELRRLAFARREPDRRTRRAYVYTFSVFDEWIAEVGERLRVVIIPDEYQVNDELYRSLVEPQADQYDRDLPTRSLRAFLDQRGVAYLDLLEPLREAEAIARTYAHNDTHWNERGNAVAAEQIARWLRSGGG